MCSSDLEKIFFLPGDTVTLKQDLPNKPIMLVVQKGFSKMYQDATLLLAADKKFSELGFPEFMNVDPYLNIPVVYIKAGKTYYK